MTMLPDDEAMKKAIAAGTIAADEYWIGEKFGDSQEDADLAFLRAAIRALDAAGWQCVPKVATEEMKQAADRLLGKIHDCDTPYNVMLAAAPKLVEVKP